MTTIIDEVKLDFDDVFIRPKRSPMASRSKVKLERSFQFYHAKGMWSGIPIIASNMDTTGTMNMTDELSRHCMYTALHKHYDVQELIDKITDPFVQNYTFYTMGITDQDFSKLNDFIIKWRTPLMICVDVANGYTDYFVSKVAEIRKLCNNSIIMAGNVCTPEMVQELIVHGGADIVKIGNSNGSVCKTYDVTGIRYPQLSAIMECADVAHGLKKEDKRLGLICADGGCKTNCKMSIM